MNMQKQVQKGFTLIELMIVIAIVGILAAIALPAYQDYIVRSKMSEPLAALAEAKTSVSEYYASNNDMPPTADLAGIFTNPNKDIVASVGYTSINGLPLITAGIQADVIPGADGDTVNEYWFLSVRNHRRRQHPGLESASPRRLVWLTGGTLSVVMPSKYLPSNCR